MREVMQKDNANIRNRTLTAVATVNKLNNRCIWSLFKNNYLRKHTPY